MVAAPSASVELMFDPLEGWPETLGNGRLVDPPLTVTVDLGALFPPGPGQSNTQPLRISKGGLAVTGYAAGELLAWARTTSGAWIGCVRFVVEPANKLGQVPMLQWMPSTSIRPGPGHPPRQ